MYATGSIPRWLASAAAATAGLAWAPALSAKPLSAAEQAVVDQRVARTAPSTPKIALAPGDTVYLERTVEVKAGRIRGPETDFEGLVTGVVSPEGVVVHPRIDRVRIEPAGAKTRLHFTYVVHADPGFSSGGRVKLTLSLVERRGLANTLAKQEVTHWVSVDPTPPSPRDLAASFHGYRLYGARAQAGRVALAKANLQLALREDVRLPPLNRASGKAMARVLEFIQDRHRLWAAHRQLVTASQSPDSAVANAARAYLSALDTPDDRLTGLPAVALVESAAPPPPREAEVVRLEPTASEPASGPSGEGGQGGDALTPVGSYDSSGDGDPEQSLPSRRTADELPPEEAPPPEPVVASAPGAEAAPRAADEVVEELQDDPFADNGVRRYIRIPSYNRGLVLDDPNIAHGGGFRMVWANVKVREPAVTTVFFFDAQFALTRYLGVELTVPTQYVDVENTRSVFAAGNPLLAVKWRLFLPEILGRRPALTLRARLGIPLFPLHSVATTSRDAEDYTREAHFSDTYAFFLEKTDVGLGATAAWQHQFLYVGAQVYADYFIPVSDALDRSQFLTFNYGLSVGALPFGDLVGFYAEARATSLLAGPGRTELFTYLGARARLLDHLEPALWVAFPLGSVRNANTFQLGAELRFSYDLYDVVDAGGAGRRDSLFE